MIDFLIYLLTQKHIGFFSKMLISLVRVISVLCLLSIRSQDAVQLLKFQTFKHVAERGSSFCVFQERL